MPRFLSEAERAALRSYNDDPRFSNLYWGLVNRVKSGGELPGLEHAGTDTEYRHHVLEFLSDTALVCAVTGDKRLAGIVRHVALTVAELPLDDWIGPFFRDHTANPPRGHLETAHLAVGLAVAFDLLGDSFSPEEKGQIETALRERAIPLCRAWLQANSHLANWRCILLSGLAVPAAVLGDEAALDEAEAEYRFCLNVVQPDGSYGESLQYANYCFRGLMLTHEALLRAGRTPGEMPYAKCVHWFRQSLLYNKPLSGWGAHPRPRSLNFNDSAALCGPDPDLLIHIACRARETMPEEAALARRMFDELYTANPLQGPFDRSSFGFLNRYGFLSLLLYRQAAAPAAEDGAVPCAAFSNGDRIARSGEGGEETVLGFRAGSAGLHAPGHLHGDANSLILVHRRERLLADPGHSCYRNRMRELDLDPASHNTCTFEWNGASLGQKPTPGRTFDTDRKLAPPPPRGGKPLFAGRTGRVTAFANDAAEAYGDPITRFERFTILAGSHALFVIDRIAAREPVTAAWHWLFNNRDGELDWKLLPPDRIVARRGEAGMKLFHLGENTVPQGPVYSYVHDAYHALPNRKGEGAPGSGLQFNWRETAPAAHERTVIHAIALDAYGPVSQWHIRREPHCALAGRNEEWELQCVESGFVVTEKKSGESVGLLESGGIWSMLAKGGTTR